jgi:hypothetical protein
MKTIETVAELDAQLSQPTAGVLEALQAIDGDFIVLGAGGKMGPTLARMLRRGLDQIGHSQRRVTAVSRFSSASTVQELQAHGIVTIRCDLMDRAAVQALPSAANVIFMAGQKFGTHEDPDLTWAMNTSCPSLCC